MILFITFPLYAKIFSGVPWTCGVVADGVASACRECCLRWSAMALGEVGTACRDDRKACCRMAAWRSASYHLGCQFLRALAIMIFYMLFA